MSANNDPPRSDVSLVNMLFIERVALLPQRTVTIMSFHRETRHSNFDPRRLIAWTSLPKVKQLTGSINQQTNKQTNKHTPRPLARKRTIPTE
jgi:hypothetical protein